jgi:hypothetical protein
MTDDPFGLFKKEEKPIDSVDPLLLAASTIEISEIGKLNNDHRTAFNKSKNGDLLTYEDCDIEITDADLEAIGNIEEFDGSPMEIGLQIIKKNLLLDMKSNDIKVRFLAHLEANYGLISYALRGSGMKKGTYNRLMKDDNEFALNVRSMTSGDMKLDLAEHTLLRNMERGSVQASKIELENNGGERGYGKNNDPLIRKLMNRLKLIEGEDETDKTALDMETYYKRIIKEGRGK